MWLLKLPFRFLVRQGWWAVRLFAVGLSVLVYKVVVGLDVVQFPGMEEPYTVGATDPVIAAGVFYFIISRVLQKIVNGIIGDVSQGFGQLRSTKKDGE